MKLSSSLATVLVLTCAALANAQTPEMPKPGAEHQKLAYFIGTWQIEGEIKPGPYGPGGKMSGTEHVEWMPGGFFTISHSDSKSAMGDSKGLAIMGYKNEDKAYTFNEFNSTGETVEARGTTDGTTWTWTTVNMMMGPTKMKGRYTVKIASPTAYSFKLEAGPETGDWMTIMEGKASKTSTAK